ncbi:histone-lysine N-methyltransferase [Aspergillus heteromorphus CBS 117.55]|uniref:Histone-lysine N-methyltransferase n=1 Tax=Aspergillus heteromorphus CBS 117.55 TaxID=1448321 RepID=A0A317UT38_9EURO|nr:histone-lysine N-methyltransferase [Aspergillus heteromorphus CBS 117.55]PWY64519.1 histone-lysine N-methyltransferase [Aspergillus heteromorphus CBS 117.55]
MASTQPPGSSAPSSNLNSPILPPGGAPFFNGSLPDTNARSSPVPLGNFSAQADGSKSKRTKRDSRKKREAKGLDQENMPSKKRTVTVHNAAIPSSELSILRPLLLSEPRASDLLPPQPRQMNFVNRKVSDIIGQSWDFYEIADKLTNKNGFRYSYAIADPAFPHIKYRQTDVYPYHPRFSFEDSPAAILFSEDALAVTTNEPWHTARANVCAREGSYYYETRIISGVVNNSLGPSSNGKPGLTSRGHVRLGFARREADLDVNVGVDCYGYGIRDVNGEVVNRMRCEYFFPKGESIQEGDVIGLLITLPRLSLHKKVVEGTYDHNADGHALTPSSDALSAMNIIRDRIPFHYKSDFCWQQSNMFPTKQLRDYAFNLKETPTFGPPSPFNGEDASLRTLPGSSITVFKNGVKMGTPFKELYAFLPPASRLANGTNNLGIGERENADDGMIGYYPAVSCYGGGAVECRFEGPWWVGPPSHTENGEPVQGIGERFNEQIVEDVVCDIVDEVEAMCVWGGVDGNVVNNAELDDSGTGAVGGSEVLKGGVGAAYEAAMPADLENQSVVIGNLPGNEAAQLADLDPGHTAIEEATSADAGGTPITEAHLLTVPEAMTGDGDGDVEMS